MLNDYELNRKIHISSNNNLYLIQNMIIGTEEFIAWFYAVIWKKLEDISKKTYGKYLFHSSGLILIILGMIFTFRYITSIFVFIGLVLIFGGIIIFITPFS